MICDKTFFGLGILAVLAALIQDAYAYIDPGSGSVIIQIIIGGLVGIGITIKIYWHKIKFKVQEKFSKD